MFPNEPIYEAVFVKPPVQECLGEISIRFPRPRRRSACPSQPSPWWRDSAFSRSIPEPEAEAGQPKEAGREH